MFLSCVEYTVWGQASTDERPLVTNIQCIWVGDFINSKTQLHTHLPVVNYMQLDDSNLMNLTAQYFMLSFQWQFIFYKSITTGTTNV